MENFEDKKIIIGRKSEEESCRLIEAKVRNYAVAIILLLAAVFVDFVILLNVKDGAYGVAVGLLFAVLCIFAIAVILWYKSTHYWRRGEGCAVYIRGKKQEVYPDEDVTEVLCISKNHKANAKDYRVCWGEKRSAVFVCNDFVPGKPNEKTREWTDFFQKLLEGNEEIYIKQARYREREKIKNAFSMEPEKAAKRVRILVWLIGLLSVAMFFIGARCIDNMRLMYGLFMCLPLCNLVLPCLFPMLFFMEKPAYAAEDYKEWHVKFPIVFFCISTVLLLLVTPHVRILNMERAVMLGTVIYLIFCAMAAVCMLRGDKKEKRKAGRGELSFLLIICFQMIYTTPGMTGCFIMAGSSHDSVHIEAAVEDKHISNGKRDYYYLHLAMGEGEPVRMEVSEGLYQATEIGDTVTVCETESLFGIVYQRVHK